MLSDQLADEEISIIRSALLMMMRTEGPEFLDHIPYAYNITMTAR